MARPLNQIVVGYRAQGFLHLRGLPRRRPCPHRPPCGYAGRSREPGTTTSLWCVWKCCHRPLEMAGSGLNGSLAGFQPICGLISTCTPGSEPLPSLRLERGFLHQPVDTTRCRLTLRPVARMPSLSCPCREPQKSFSLLSAMFTLEAGQATLSPLVS